MVRYQQADTAGAAELVRQLSAEMMLVLVRCGVVLAPASPAPRWDCWPGWSGSP